jgi:hypothetical protein
MKWVFVPLAAGLMVSPASAQIAVPETPATPAPNQPSDSNSGGINFVADFLAACSKNMKSDDCSGNVSGTIAVGMMTAGQGHPFCVPNEGLDTETTKVVNWLSGHSDMRNKDVLEGILTALQSLYQCP